MNSGMIMIILKDWAERDRDGLVIAREISGKLGAIPGIFGFAGMQQGMAGGRGAQIQFVLSGPDYDTVAGWADLIAARAKQNPGLTRVDTDFKPTKPKFDVDIDRERAAALGVSVQAIGDTLQTMMGSRRVTTYMDRGREYDVILQARDEDRQAPSDISNIFVRSSRAFRGPLIPLANLVEINSIADAADRKRWNRLPAVTISANLAAGYSMGEALDYLEQMVAEEIPSGPKIDYNGESRRFKKQGSALMFAFGFALLVVFLVLAAQFESFIHPFVIMLTVPVAIAGALLGLYFIGSSLNLFSQIGLIILIGIAAKNGILIVEFANQLRDQGLEFQEALLTASETRFRPIVMTGVSTSAGSIPLLLATGAGAGSRITIGIVIFLGVLISTVMTLFIVPIFYNLLARGTGSPGRIARMLSDYERQKTIVGTSTSSTPAQ
jgi:multidrug efflux pump